MSRGLRTKINLCACANVRSSTRSGVWGPYEEAISWLYAAGDFLPGVLIWRYGAQNSASGNLLAPTAIFAAPHFSVADWGSIPGYVYTIAQREIESSGGSSKGSSLAFGQEYKRSRVSLAASITRINNISSVVAHICGSGQSHGNTWQFGLAHCKHVGEC